MSYERKLAPDQPAANDPQYRDTMKRYETSDYTMTVTPGDGNLYVHVECQSCKDKDARIAGYQDELVDKHNALLDAEAKMVEEHEARCLSIRHATGLEAEVERLRKGLRLIIERSPGQAHRIAIQMLDPARAEEGGEE